MIRHCTPPLGVMPRARFRSPRPRRACGNYQSRLVSNGPPTTAIYTAAAKAKHTAHGTVKVWPLRRAGSGTVKVWPLRSIDASSDQPHFKVFLLSIEVLSPLHLPESLDTRTASPRRRPIVYSSDHLSPRARAFLSLFDAF